MAESYKTAVKKPSEVAVGEKLRLVSEVSKKLKGAIKEDDMTVDVASVGENSVNVGFMDVQVPARVVAGIKWKLYRKAKPRGKTVKKAGGSRRRSTQRRK